VCFFDGGVVFFNHCVVGGILEGYIGCVLRSRCYADAIRIEEGLLSFLYTLIRNFGEHRFRE